MPMTMTTPETVTPTPAWDAYGDDALLEAYARDRQPEAFAELARRYQHTCFRMAFARCGNVELAEDIVQESLLQLALKPQTRGAATFRSWMFGIVNNVTRHFSRTERRASRKARNPKFIQEAQAMERQQADTRQAALDADSREQLTQALGGLDENQRQPLILHFIEGLTQSEVGELLGVSQPMIARRIAQGLEALRARLAGAGAAVSAVALPGLLQDASLLQAPAQLQAVVTSKSFLAAATAARESMRAGAVLASKPAAGLWWAAGALSVLALAGGAYWLQPPAGNHNSVKEASGTAARHQQPTDTAPGTVSAKELHWDFSAAEPKSDVRLAGDWKWQLSRHTNHHALMAFDQAEWAYLQLPVKTEGQPLRVVFTLKGVQPGKASHNLGWLEGKRLLPSRFYLHTMPGGMEIKTPFITEFYVFDKYVAEVNGKSLLYLREYDKPQAGTHLYFRVKNLAVIEIQAAPVPEEKLPFGIKQVQALLEEAAKTNKVYLTEEEQLDLKPYQPQR